MSSAIDATGPRPGSTPTSVPTSTPIRHRYRLCSSSATPKPWASWAKSSTLEAQQRGREIHAQPAHEDEPESRRTEHRGGERPAPARARIEPAERAEHEDGAERESDQRQHDGVADE